MKKIFFILILSISSCGKNDVGVNTESQTESAQPGPAFTPTPVPAKPSPGEIVPIQPSSLLAKNIGPSIFSKIKWFYNCTSYDTFSGCQTDLFKFYYDNNKNVTEIRKFKNDMIEWYINDLRMIDQQLEGDANFGDCTVGADDKISCKDLLQVKAKVFQNNLKEITSFSVVSGANIFRKFDYNFVNGWMNKLELTYENKIVQMGIFEEINGKYFMSLYAVENNVKSFNSKSSYEKIGKEVQLKMINNSGELVGIMIYEFVN